MTEYLLSYIPAAPNEELACREILSKLGVDLGPFCRATGGFELCLASFAALRAVDERRHLGERVGGHTIATPELKRFVMRARLAAATCLAGQRDNAELVEHELMDEVLRYIHQGGAMHVIASRIALAPSMWLRP